MKTNLLPTTLLAVGVAALALAPFTPAQASLAQYQNQSYANDFSSGTESGWTHLSIFAMSSGQTWNAGTGAYQLTALANGYTTYGFAGSVVTGNTITDGFVQADILAQQGSGAYGGWGLATRIQPTTIGIPLGLQGYALVYEPYGNSGLGDLRIQRLGPPSTFNSVGSAANISLTPGASYTMTLETTGSSLVGSLWAQGQVGTSLIAQVTGTDAVYGSGLNGVFVITSGLVAPSVGNTFDNYLVMVPEPGTGTLLGLGLVGFLARRRLARGASGR